MWNGWSSRGGRDGGAGQWAIERGVFVQIDVNRSPASIPRSPFRLSKSEAGSRYGVYLQGRDNRTVISSWLGLSDAEIDALESEGVLVSRQT